VKLEDLGLCRVLEKPELGILKRSLPSNKVCICTDQVIHEENTIHDQSCASHMYLGDLSCNRAFSEYISGVHWDHGRLTKEANFGVGVLK